MLHAILRLEGAVAESYDYKELVALFNSFPKEETVRQPPSPTCIAACAPSAAAREKPESAC